MVALQLDAILMIALFVATAGLAISRLFVRLDRPYLFRFTGNRIRLFTLRFVMYVSAALASIGVCCILLVTLPLFPALAIFFAFEAIVLDICSQRIDYVRVSEISLARSTARASQRGTVTGAF